MSIVAQHQRANRLKFGHQMNTTKGQLTKLIRLIVKYPKVFAAILILWNPCCYLYTRLWYDWVKNHPKGYLYSEVNKIQNPVLCVSGERYFQKLKDYYDADEQWLLDSIHNAQPFINFPLDGFPMIYPAYIVGYSKDSTFFEVICFWEHKGPSYERGWVLSKHFHKEPPTQE